MTNEKRVNNMRWFGALLILLGILSLADQFLNIRLGRVTWPLFIFVPGVVMLLAALRSDESAGEAFAILGGILTMLGLLLFYQNLVDHWASWAYAWALIAPTGVGLGQWLYGTARQRPDMVKTGKDLTTIGLIIFAAGFTFFELILNISGLNLGVVGWGILLILLGAWVLVKPLFSKS